MKTHFKTKTGKKVLALFMAVLMAATSIPFSALAAITYSSDETFRTENPLAQYLLAEYFTTSNPYYDAVTDDTSALTYDSGTITGAYDGTATFTSAYLHITDSSFMDEIDSDTGISFSFEYTMSDSTNHQALLSFGQSAFDSGTTWTNCFYMCAAQHWKASSILFTDYVTSAENGLGAYPGVTLSTSTRYHCYVTISSSEIVYYINGVKYSANWYGDDNSSNLSALLNSFSDWDYNYIGRSRWNDNAFSGTIRDFCIYNKTLTEEEVMSASALSDYESDSVWTSVASSDFSNVSWSSLSSVSSSNNYQYATDVATVNGKDETTLSWQSTIWGSSVTSDDYGTYIPDGFMHVTGSSTNTFPLQNADNFKIDVQFNYKSDWSNTTSTDYCFMTLGGTEFGKLDGTAMSSASYVFAQDMYGAGWASGTSFGENSASYSLYTGTETKYTDASVYVGETYHYILTYYNGYLKAVVTDVNYKTLYTIFTTQVTLDTSAINSLCLGDDNWSNYNKYINYQSIEMYTADSLKLYDDNDDDTCYLFAYFTGNTQSGQKIRFAVSEDGYNFDYLNGNSPVISQTAGDSSTSAGYARDPYIFKDQNGEYWIIATDMDASTSGMHSSWDGDTCMVLFHSTDLLEWEQTAVIDMASLDMTVNVDGYADNLQNSIRVWAPQIFYDDTCGKYLIYWSQYFSNWNEAICGFYVDDLHDFDSYSSLSDVVSEVINMFDLASAPIDADIIYNENDGLYYMFYKDEDLATVCYVTSETLTGGYSGIVECTYSTKAVEGVSVYQIGDTGTYMMMLDEYADYTYIAQASNDLKTWSKLVEGTDYTYEDLSARHGSVIQITHDEYDALVAKWGVNSDPIEYYFNNGLDFSTGDSWMYESGAIDSSGHTYDIMGNASQVSLSNGTIDYPSAYVDDLDTTVSLSEQEEGTLHLFRSNLFINDPDVENVVDNDNGQFTVSFEYIKKASSMLDDYDNTAVDFSKAPIISVSDSTTDYIKILNNSTLVIYTTDEEYVSIDFSDTIRDGSTYLITISCDLTATEDQVVVYMDGRQVATSGTNSVYYFADTDSGETVNHGDTFYVALGYTDVYANNDRIYADYSKLKFWDSCLDFDEVQLNTSLNLETLDDIIETFESLINSGNAYTEVTEAYEKYEQALRCNLIYKYGSDDEKAEITDDDIEAITTDFADAVRKMSLFDSSYDTQTQSTLYAETKTVASGYVAKSGNTVNSSQSSGGWQIATEDDTSHSLAACSAASDGTIYEAWLSEHYGNSSDPYVAASVYADSYFFLYDGETELSAPVKVRWYRSTSTTGTTRYRGLYGISISASNDGDVTAESSYLDMVSQTDDSLYMVTTTNNSATYCTFNWPTAYTSTVANNYTTGIARTNGFTINNTGTAKANHYYGYFYAKVSDSFEPTSTLTTINPLVTIIDSEDVNVFGNSGYSYDDNDETTFYYADGYAATYYVVDVTKVTGAIDDLTSYIQDQTVMDIEYNYAHELFELLDTLTAFDPYDYIEYDDNGYISSTDMATQAQALADAIDDLETKANEFLAQDTVEIDTVAYNTLYDILPTSIYQDYIADDGTYTDTTYAAYVDAYDALVAYIDSLDDFDMDKEATGVDEEIHYLVSGDTTYYDDETALDIVVNFLTAYHELMPTTSYLELYEVLTSDGVTTAEGTDNLDDDGNQLYTISSWLNFDTSYNTADAFSTDNPSYDDESALITYAMYTTESSLIEEIYANGGEYYANVATDTYTNDYQESLDDAEDLTNTYNALALVAADEYYDSYNEAQQLSASADLDAYVTTAQDTLNTDAALGYLNTSDEGVNVDEYENGTSYYDDSGNLTAVYLSYNGTVYKNASTADAQAVDDTTAEILNTLNEETNLVTYTVTFNLYVNGAENPTATYTKDYSYGENVTFDPSDKDQFPDFDSDTYNSSNYVVARWEVQSENAEMSIVKNDAFTLTREIQQDTTVNLYLEEIDSSGTLVTVVDYYGTILDRGYVDADTAATFPTDRGVLSQETTISFTDTNSRTHSIDVNESADLKFYGWKSYTTTDDEGNEVIRVYQSGTSLLGSGDIAVSGGTLTDQKTGSSVTDDTLSCTLQNLVDVTASDTTNFFAWLETTDGTNYYVASYEPTFTTFAYESGITYIAVSKDDMEQYITDADTLKEALEYEVPFSFGVASDTVTVSGSTKFRLYCNFSINDDYGTEDSKVEIVQYGVLGTKESYLSGSVDKSDYYDYIVKGADKVTTIAANAASEYNTYTVTTSASSSDTVYMRSFVSYMYTYETDDGKSVTVPRVAYGDIYACNSNHEITQFSVSE